MTSDYYTTIDDHANAHSGTTWVLDAIAVGGQKYAPERSENMRGLYRIIVVNPKTEAISGPYFVVAKDESGALLKAELHQNVRANSDDYDFIVDRLGDVRAKKDVQKVKVVKEDES